MLWHALFENNLSLIINLMLVQSIFDFLCFIFGKMSWLLIYDHLNNKSRFYISKIYNQGHNKSMSTSRKWHRGKMHQLVCTGMTVFTSEGHLCSYKNISSTADKNN